MRVNNKLISTFIILFFLTLSIIPNITANIEIKNKLIDENPNNIVFYELAKFKDKYEKNLSININDIQYRAVLIGINDYPGEDGDLPYSVNEINSFRKTLIDGKNWNEINIQTILNNQATINNINSSINWLSENADENDVSIFYYSGHGSRDLNNEYLFVYDGVISDVEIDEKLDNINGRVIVILDSCYSGGFVEDLKGYKRIVMAACGENNLTYQYSGFESGIFGYFVNLSLQKFTKNAELTFLFAYIGTVYYSKKLSEEYGEDYSIYPKFSDGTLGITKIINRHNLTNTFFYQLFDIARDKIRNKEFNIWRM